MERIGYIDKKSINLKNGINPFKEIEYASLEFDNRAFVEEKQSFVQPICAGVLFTEDGQVLTISKTNGATGEISPEKGKTLLYVGGHLDEVDYIKGNNLQTFFEGMKREIKEELNFEITTSLSPIVVYTPDNSKSAKHLGIIFPVIIQSKCISSFADGNCKFLQIKELKQIKNFEAWSKLIIAEIFEE